MYVCISMCANVCKFIYFVDFHLTIKLLNASLSLWPHACAPELPLTVFSFIGKNLTLSCWLPKCDVQ